MQKYIENSDDLLSIIYDFVGIYVDRKALSQISLIDYQELVARQKLLSFMVYIWYCTVFYYIQQGYYLKLF